MGGDWVKALEDMQSVGSEDVMNAMKVLSLDGIKDRSYSMEDSIAEAMDLDELWDSRQCSEELLMGWC